MITVAAKNVDELAKIVYESEEAVNVSTNYGNFVFISAEDYQYYLDMMETRAVEKNPELNQRLLDGLKADKSEFISEEEAWDV